MDYICSGHYLTIKEKLLRESGLDHKSGKPPKFDEVFWFHIEFLK